MKLYIAFITSLLPGAYLHDCARNAKLYRSKSIPDDHSISIDHYPFVVGLLKTFKHQIEFRCSAVIIHKQWTITTARCLSSETPPLVYKYWRVRGNTTRYEKNANDHSDHRISAFYVHKNYIGAENDYDYDVALVKVEQLFTGLNEKPVCFATDLFKYGDNSSLNFFGWRDNRMNPYLLTGGEFKSFNLKLYNFQKCSQMYHSLGISLPSSKLCAIGLRKRDCTFDWGGPLIKKGILIGSGLSSMGSECSSDHIPWTYTKLSTFSAWILTKIYELTTEEIVTIYKE